MQWLIENKEWLFSDRSFPYFTISFYKKKDKTIKQSESGKVDQSTTKQPKDINIGPKR